MKKLLSLGNYVTKAVSFGLKAEKGIKTFSAALRHLQNFDKERTEIWGVKKETPIVEQKES